MKTDKTRKSSRRPPQKADRALGGELVFQAVTRGLQEAGFTGAMEKLTVTAERAATHDRILFGDGRDGLVNDVEHLKMNTSATLTAINLALSKLTDEVNPLVEWRRGIVVKVAVIMAAASTISAIVGAVVGVVVGSRDFVAFISSLLTKHP